MSIPTPAEVAGELRTQAACLLELAARLAPVAEPERYVPDPDAPVTPGGLLVMAERHRQVAEEGYGASHDREHDPRVLAWRAFCYLERAAQTRLPQDDPTVPAVWPDKRRGTWKPKASRIRNLTVAAALVVAEIDTSLDRGDPL